jgi:hypothetical protein
LILAVSQHYLKQRPNKRHDKNNLTIYHIKVTYPSFLIIKTKGKNMPKIIKTKRPKKPTSSPNNANNPASPTQSQPSSIANTAAAAATNSDKEAIKAQCIKLCELSEEQLNKGNYEAAAKYFEQICKFPIEPHASVALYNLATYTSEHDDLEKALSYFEKFQKTEYYRLHKYKHPICNFRPQLTKQPQKQKHFDKYRRFFDRGNNEHPGRDTGQQDLPNSPTSINNTNNCTSKTM